MFEEFSSRELTTIIDDYIVIYYYIYIFTVLICILLRRRIISRRHNIYIKTPTAVLSESATRLKPNFFEANQILRCEFRIKYYTFVHNIILAAHDCRQTDATE